MFVHDARSRTFWFRPHETGCDDEYELIGLIVGLAIYNAVILDVHFPLAVYRKLAGKPVGLADLDSSHPDLARGLRQLLEFDGDVAEVFARNFQVTYGSFGHYITEDLVEGGGDIAVTNENREEYVRLYADWVLNKSVRQQFDAFKKGFDLVTADSALKLFRPEEVELLVCGDKELDFVALQQATAYDGGFDENHPVIRNFWDVAHSLDEGQKRRLLFFATGSDRVPIGGLSKLNFVIAKNGPDSDRLPSAHTCFNVLMLCEYSSKEKLRERLLSAIENAEGFGML
eukprot:Opistho-1_new@19362